MGMETPVTAQTHKGPPNPPRIQLLSCFSWDIYIDDLDGGEVKLDFLTSAGH